jgi:hypothetical protein
METYIISFLFKQAYKAVPLINENGRYEIKIIPGIIIMLILCAFWLFGMSLYILIFFNLFAKVGWIPLLIFSAIPLLFAAHYFWRRIEYDGTGVYHYDIFSTKHIPWASIEKTVYTSLKSCEIWSFDGSKIVFSWYYAGFKSLIAEIESRLPYEKRSGADAFIKDMQHHLT